MRVYAVKNLAYRGFIYLHADFKSARELARNGKYSDQGATICRKCVLRLLRGTGKSLPGEDEILEINIKLTKDCVRTIKLKTP